ncbi:acyltransferase family protein [Flavobacterium ajazii]|uniref:acyltransferase family protein n=1 Tax=Flavobacterium ajazii TaxID=2692318 RepID=UPI0013D04FAB|nr:acyltransferase [Flavobacterium ajazii]
MKERYIYIDRLKGFTIFLVVLGHIIPVLIEDKGAHKNELFLFIYSFHMPLFFFLSGYIVYKTIKIDSLKEYLQFVKNKGINLLIPMLSWPLLEQYCFTSKTDFSFETFLGVILEEIKNPGLWFLRMLFFFLIVYSIFHIVSERFNKRKLFIYDLVILIIDIALFLILCYLLQLEAIFHHLFYFIFLMIGVFLSKYDLLKTIIANKVILSLSLLFFIVSVGHYNDLIYLIDSSQIKILKFFISVFAIIIFYHIAKNISLSNWFDNSICFLGRKSLVIYVTHFMFLTIFSKSMLLPVDISFFFLALIAVPLSLIMIYFCLLISKIVELFPIFNFLLYGVRIKK